MAKENNSKLTVRDDEIMKRVDEFLRRNVDLTQLEAEHGEDKAFFRKATVSAASGKPGFNGVFFAGTNGRGVSVTIPKPKLKVSEIPVQQLVNLTVHTHGKIEEVRNVSVNLAGAAADWFLQTLQAWETSGVEIAPEFRDAISVNESVDVVVDEFTEKAILDAYCGVTDGLAGKAQECLGDLSPYVSRGTPIVKTAKAPKGPK